MAELHSKTMISTGIALQSYCDSIHLTINPALSRSRRKPNRLSSAKQPPDPPFASCLPPAPLSSIPFSRPTLSCPPGHPPRPSHFLLSYHFLISSFPNPPACNPPPLYAS